MITLVCIAMAYFSIVYSYFSMVVLLTHETHWASWKESFWWRGWKVGRVTEFMWKRGLVMGSKIAKVVPY